MSWDISFTLDWETLDPVRLEEVVRKVAAQHEGVVATRTPHRFDEPDPDEYVRPGFEAVPGLDESLDEEGEISWYFGFPQRGKLAWACLRFAEGEGACSGSTGSGDIDPLCEDAFLDLYEHLRDALGGREDAS